MATSVTSRDVAEAAGVSQSTVSYVLSGKRFVAPDTEARVLAAMDELGYRPHVSARALRSRRSGIIGTVVPYHALTDTANQYRYVVSIAAACRKYDYELLMASSEEGIEGMRRLIDSAQCDGLVIMDVLDSDPRVLQAHEARIPSIFIGTSHDSDVTAVDTSFEEIAERCIDLIADRGHTETLILTSASEHVCAMGFSHRFDHTLTAQAAARGCELVHAQVRRGLAPMREAISQALQTRPELSAVITGPTLCADDAANALLALGLTPGEDVSLVAAAHPADSPHTEIDYTYFDADVPTVVSTAIEILINTLEGGPRNLNQGLQTISPLFHAGASLRPIS